MSPDEREMLRIGRRLGWGDTIEECLCHFWIAPDWREQYQDMPAEMVLRTLGFTSHERAAKAYLKTLASSGDAFEVARLDMRDALIPALAPVCDPILAAMNWLLQRVHKPA